MDWELVESFAYVTDIEFILFKIKLEEANVPFIAKDDNIVSVEPFISNIVGGAKVFVPKDQFIRAREILDIVRNQDHSENVQNN